MKPTLYSDAEGRPDDLTFGAVRSEQVARNGSDTSPDFSRRWFNSSKEESQRVCE